MGQGAFVNRKYKINLQLSWCAIKKLLCSAILEYGGRLVTAPTMDDPIVQSSFANLFFHNSI